MARPVLISIFCLLCRKTNTSGGAITRSKTEKRCFPQLVPGDFPLHEYFLYLAPFPVPYSVEMISKMRLRHQNWNSENSFQVYVKTSQTRLETSGLREISLRKHPFLLALRRCGRFARRNLLAKRPRQRRVRRNGCFRGLKGNLLSYSQGLVKFGLRCCQCGLVRFFFCFCSVYL